MEILIVLIIIYLVYLRAYKKVEKQFDNGLEQKLAKINQPNAREIEFYQYFIIFILADGSEYAYSFADLGYENLPKLRYTKAMAEIYQKRFLSGKNVKLEPMRLEREYHEASAGYHTTKRYDGYHTVEKKQIVESGGSKIGYKLVNYDIARTDIVKTPPKKKW